MWNANDGCHTEYSFIAISNFFSSASSSLLFVTYIIRRTYVCVAHNSQSFRSKKIVCHIISRSNPVPFACGFIWQLVSFHRTSPFYIQLSWTFWFCASIQFKLKNGIQLKKLEREQAALKSMGVNGSYRDNNDGQNRVEEHKGKINWMKCHFVLLFEHCFEHRGISWILHRQFITQFSQRMCASVCVFGWQRKKFAFETHSRI